MKPDASLPAGDGIQGLSESATATPVPASRRGPREPAGGCRRGYGDDRGGGAGWMAGEACGASRGAERDTCCQQAWTLAARAASDGWRCAHLTRRR